MQNIPIDFAVSVEFLVSINMGRMLLSKTGRTIKMGVFSYSFQLSLAIFKFLICLAECSLVDG